MTTRTTVGPKTHELAYRPPPMSDIKTTKILALILFFFVN